MQQRIVIWQVEQIKGEQNTVRNIMEGKRLGGNQYAALASWNKPNDNEDLNSDQGNEEEADINTKKVCISKLS